jgi:hypothetical protein
MFTQIGLCNLWKDLLAESGEPNPYFEIIQNTSQTQSMKILCAVDGVYRSFKREVAHAADSISVENEPEWHLVSVEKVNADRYWVLPTKDLGSVSASQILSAA